MKKLLLLLILFLGIHYNGLAQAKNFLDLKVTKDSALVNGNYEIGLMIEIFGKKGPYKIELFNNLLNSQRKLIVSQDNYNESTIHFDNLPKTDALFIYVESIKENKGITTKIRL